MKILAFDTVLEKMYVTIAQDDKVIASTTVETTKENYHSAFLISTIANILNENNIKPQDLDAIATNVGPGSFTGIRACMTVARVMAQQLNIKAIGISSLEILSHLAPPDKKALVALDARKNKAYLYIDEVKGAVELDEVQQLAKSGEYYVVTDRRLQPLLGGISYETTDKNLGKILVELAFEKSAQDNNWLDLKPLYIQPPPVGG